MNQDKTGIITTAKNAKEPREDSILKTYMKVLKYQSDQGSFYPFGFFFLALLAPWRSWRLNPSLSPILKALPILLSSTAFQSTRKRRS